MSDKLRRAWAIILMLTMLFGTELANSVISYGSETIPSNVRVVYSSEDLKNALAAVNVDTIYLGNDITISHNMPIKNDNATRTTPEITIYGYNPYAGETADSVRRQLIETSNDKTTGGNRIWLNGYKGALKAVTLRDIKVYGTDWYGTVFVHKNKNYSGFTLNHINFEYIGPQLNYNVYGNAHYENADITIYPTTNKNATGEVAEINNVTMAGYVNITKDARADYIGNSKNEADELFWGSDAVPVTIRVLSGADVNIVNNRQVSGSAWGFDSSGFLSTYNIYSKVGTDSIYIEDEAKFRYEGYGVFIDHEHLLNTFSVGKNADVHIRIKGDLSHTNAPYESLLAANYLNVGEGSKVAVIADGNTKKYPAIHVQTQANINNPESMVVYNSNTSQQAISGSGILNVTGINIRHFISTLTDAQLDELISGEGPAGDRRWYQTNNALFTVSGTTFRNYNNPAPDASPINQYSLNANAVVYNGEAASRSTVTYYPNSGDGDAYVDGNLLWNTQYRILDGESTGIVKEDYRIKSWNTKYDGSGAAYEPGEVIHITENLELYAQWEYQGNLYLNIFYLPTTGRGTHTQSGCLSGEAYQVINPYDHGIDKPYYEFVAWNTEADGSGDTYKIGDFVIMPNEDLFLYAQWEYTSDIYYTVAYDSHGFGWVYLDEMLTPGDYEILSAKQVGFEPFLYKLKFWYDDDGNKYSPGEVISLKRYLTLYAEWELDL